MEPFNWLAQPKFSADDVRGIALGAYYQVMEWRSRNAETHCDDLDYRKAKFANRRDLKRAWSLTGPDDAMQAMVALLEGMHSPDFDEVLSLVAGFRRDAPGVQQELLHRLAADHGPAVVQAAAETLTALARPGAPETLPSSTYAWDLARMAMLARRTVAVGWFAPQDVLGLLHEGVARSRQRFGGWQEYAASFALGRALWTADEGPAEIDESFELTRMADHVLFTDQASPWLRLPW